MENKDKKIIFSAIQPSGTVTLGNYIGALKNWVDMQEKFRCVYALADLHTITVRQQPAEFRKNILEAYALLLACGIDIEKSLFFMQSHVHTHAELAWILSCYAQYGEMARMTQFKLKSDGQGNNVNLGLFSYPCLMAADILLYRADMVPVGADQKQHLELSRNIAQRFNGIYGDVFKVPEPYIPKLGARVMSLQDPSKKMSKSDNNVNSYVGILDTPDVIMRKFKRAVTDSDNRICVEEGKDGINNLIGIYCSVTNSSQSETVNRFEGRGYGEFKAAVAEAVIDHLAPIRENYKRYISDRAYLQECYSKSAEIALDLSGRILNKVMKKIGFILK